MRDRALGAVPAEPLEGLVLDFDGLVVDTETPIYEEWRAAYRERGHDLGLDLWQHALGTKGGFDPCGPANAKMQASLPRLQRMMQLIESVYDAGTLIPGGFGSTIADAAEAEAVEG